MLLPRLFFIVCALYTSVYSIAQDTYVHCGYDNDTTYDEILQRVEACQPAVLKGHFFINDTSEGHFVLPPDSCAKVSLLHVDLYVPSRNDAVRLIAGADFIFDCEKREVIILREDILSSPGLVELTWFYCDCR